MTNSADYEAERLDRLERESRRRRWDSVIVNRAAREPTAPNPQTPRPVATDPPLETDALAVFEMMVDRLDHLERVAARLDAELRHAEKHGRHRYRVGAMLMVAGFLIVALLPLVTRLGDIVTALAAK